MVSTSDAVRLGQLMKSKVPEPDAAQSKRSEKLLRAIAEGTAAATGDEFFHSLARHLAGALGARYAFVAETLSELESRSLAFWEGTDFGAASLTSFRAHPASGWRRATLACR